MPSSRQSPPLDSPPEPPPIGQNHREYECAHVLRRSNPFPIASPATTREKPHLNTDVYPGLLTTPHCVRFPKSAKNPQNSPFLNMDVYPGMLTTPHCVRKAATDEGTETGSAPVLSGCATAVASYSDHIGIRTELGECRRGLRSGWGDGCRTGGARPGAPTGALRLGYGIPKATGQTLPPTPPKSKTIRSVGSESNPAHGRKRKGEPSK